MTFIIFLWLLVWGGIFSTSIDIRLQNLFSNPIAFLTGVRPLLPIIAVYICLMWLFITRSKIIPTSKNPLRYLYFYCLVGIVSSLFFSPEKAIALYWGFNYFSTLIVIWVGLERENPKNAIRTILYLNYIIVIAISLSLLPEAFRLGITVRPSGSMYSLPFNLGKIRVNGAGRFAMAGIIISFVRLITGTKKWQYLWLILLLPLLYFLAQTESRTALLGLAITSIFFVFLKGINIQYLFIIGPISAYVFWLSAFKWRAQESIESLIDLTGRQYTWQRGIELFKHSPFLGSGFHADRLMLNYEHMHNSYFHTLVQSGIIGSVFFLVAIISIWFLIIRNKLLKRVRDIKGVDQQFLMESILLLAFLTSRSFFESTAAFYGVDLVLFVPSLIYIHLWIQENPLKQLPEESKFEEV